MFLPLRFIHPVRTKRWRPVSLSVAALWTVLALIAALTKFHPGMAVQVGLIVSSLYLLGAGMAQQLIDRLR